MACVKRAVGNLSNTVKKLCRHQSPPAIIITPWNRKKSCEKTAEQRQVERRNTPPLEVKMGNLPFKHPSRYHFTGP